MKSLRRYSAIVAATGALSFASGAQAADWSGMYWGVNGGIADVTYTLTDIDFDWFGGTMDRQKVGFTLGGTFGWQTQSEGMVYGVETDANFVSAKVEEDYDGAGSVELSQDMKWSLTVRGRAGLPMESTLLYVTGGLALADFDQEWIEIGDPADSWPDLGDTAWGYAAGFGIEHGAWKVELLHLQFDEWSSKNQNGFDMLVAPSVSYIRYGWNFRL